MSLTTLPGRSRQGRTTEELRKYLRNYYGKVLTRTEDLEMQACCSVDTLSRHADTLELIPDEVKQRNYGCGCSIPQDDLAGLSVLDLGSGSGLDAFILSHLVGESGRVFGLDMTDEQLDVSRRNVVPVMAAFGYSRPNTEFHKEVFTDAVWGGYPTTWTDAKNVTFDPQYVDEVEEPGWAIKYFGAMPDYAPGKRYNYANINLVDSISRIRGNTPRSRCNDRSAGIPGSKTALETLSAEARRNSSMVCAPAADDKSMSICNTNSAQDLAIIEITVRSHRCCTRASC